MAPSVLGTADFWREVLERAGRQAAQTALPIVAVVGASGVFDAKAAVVAVLGAILLTLLKALAGVIVAPDEGKLWQLLDRAVSAAAGVLLGFIPVDLSGLLEVDWKAALYGAVCAAVTAVLAYYVTPPSSVAVARALPDYAPVGEVL